MLERTSLHPRIDDSLLQAFSFDDHEGVRVCFGPDHFRDARTDGDTLVVQVADEVVVTVEPQPEPDVEREGA